MSLKLIFLGIALTGNVLKKKGTDMKSKNKFVHTLSQETAKFLSIYGENYAPFICSALAKQYVEDLIERTRPKQTKFGRRKKKRK